jgi:glutaredoxin
VQEFLAQRGVGYIERDIVADPTAMSELEALGFFTTPVTVINGQAVVGFNRPELERLLSA